MTSAQAAVERFNAAFDRQDVAAIAAAVTDDFEFEDTSPPDGRRHRHDEALALFAELFREPRSFTTEAMVAAGDRVVVTWLHRWSAGQVRGVDLFRVRDGKVAEKISYVKG